ncbi:G protein alpha q subunit,Guanine nucleotide-binding protein subunit alpha-11,Guanine nucleotide-binding protein G(q) subunit alpha [Mytilus coruscus]|uniref:Guanine nucleotide-binding protein G(q) subunit alpha n=1 Tax=Mytilus coruscus TaxID=42192 RepID=A0A6J8DJ39_MYTCO|nr:G protein alpha q subunit,Guanine nucleotide-binding protein subunit alpha-11,Guanine nucleotide-binding protein G(q) subunit alpha [Mytilus coruscus]
MLCYRNEQKRENKNIEKRIKRDKRDLQEEVKVLLLGTNQSGKSTLIRQLKIVHGVGFSEDEIRSFIVPIHHQIVTTIQDLIFAMDLLKIDYKNPENKENARKLMQKEYTNVRTFAKEDINTIKKLWSEPWLRQCCKEGREYQLSDSQRYFMHHIDRVTESNYLPSLLDILHSTVHFHGIAEYLYHIGDLLLRIIDIRGPRTERRKWIHYFENIPALMFIAALSDYDQIEIYNTNRMDLAKTLFETCINNQWSKTCGIMLLLNKKDVLEEKILVSNLVDYFPEFKDTENVRYIPVVVKDVILERNLKTYQGKSCCCF